MSDPTSKRPLLRHPRWFAGAALVGIVAGVGAVYVSGGFAGNADAAECRAAVDDGKRIAAGATATVAGFMAAETPTDLSALAFRNADGSDVTLADYAGKTVLLNLWATWCAPCRAEMPSLDALEKKRGTDDFQVVAVSVDTKDDGRAGRFFDETGIDTLELHTEPTLQLFNTLKSAELVEGLPTTLLIDKAGCHVGSLAGAAEWDSPEAIALIDAATKPQ
ncbi:redoxin family protein [Amorphus sp. 3PC139-8]|uniref:thiol:disulfide interchange protein TlpA n=1 Tax=Amorphus sp. 3PC139-8 TaxID=2735676 RepID=UPI00345D5F18